MENIENPKLVAAIAALKSEGAQPSKKTQDALTAAIIDATFLLPIATMPKGVKVPLDSLPPAAIKTGDGKIWIPLFTDGAEMKKGSQVNLPKKTEEADISDCFAYLTELKNLSGAIVNPFGENLVLPRDLVERIAKLWSKVKTAQLNGEELPQPGQQRLTLSVPKVYPDGVEAFLNAGLKKAEDVSAAWMCTVKKEGEENFNWLVIIDTEIPIKGREEIFRTVAQELLPYLDGKNVAFTEMNPQFQGIAENSKPLYTRGELTDI